MVRDQSILTREINRWTNISSLSQSQLSFLKDLYKRNCKALVYYSSLSKEEQEQFKDPLKWRDTPEMNYVMDMADLF